MSELQLSELGHRNDKSSIATVWSALGHEVMSRVSAALCRSAACYDADGKDPRFDAKKK